MRRAALALILCVALAGCATMRYPCAYKIEGQEFKEFKDLDDERALKIVALIYNVQPDSWETGIARSVTLEEYQGLLKKRNSAYVKSSGIFDIQYDRVKFPAWKDQDLIKLYDALAPRACRYYADSAPELNELENARRIVYLTGTAAVVRELKKRDLTQRVMTVAGQVLASALSIALAMI